MIPQHFSVLVLKENTTNLDDPTTLSSIGAKGKHDEIRWSHNTFQYWY